MKVVAFAGYSGSGKTTLVEQLIGCMRMKGLRVSVVKHAHHNFDIDKPGKDSWRHREAGAFEVLVASNQRLVLQRQFEQPAQLSVHHLLAEVYDGVDWVLVEGFKQETFPKLEVYRSVNDKAPLWLGMGDIIGLVTDVPNAASHGEKTLPHFDLSNAQAIADFVQTHAAPLGQG